MPGAYQSQRAPCRRLGHAADDDRPTWLADARPAPHLRHDPVRRRGERSGRPGDPRALQPPGHRAVLSRPRGRREIALRRAIGSTGTLAPARASLGMRDFAAFCKRYSRAREGVASPPVSGWDTPLVLSRPRGRRAGLMMLSQIDPGTLAPARASPPIPETKH